MTDDIEIERLKSTYQPKDDLDMIKVLVQFLSIYANQENWKSSTGAPPHYLRDEMFLDFHPSNVVDGHVFAREAIDAVHRYMARRMTKRGEEVIEQLKSTLDHEGKKYLRTIYDVDNSASVNVDVYEVIIAFGVTCPARAHAIKKLLCCGNRSKGDEISDLVGVQAAVSRAIQLQEGRQTHERH